MSAETVASNPTGGDDLLDGWQCRGPRAISEDGDVVRYGFHAVDGVAMVRGSADVIPDAGAVPGPRTVRAATSAWRPSRGTATTTSTASTWTAPTVTD